MLFDFIVNQEEETELQNLIREEMWLRNAIHNRIQVVVNYRQNE